MAYELNPYQGLSISNLGQYIQPVVQASSPTLSNENYDTGVARAEAAKSRIKKDTLSAKLEAAFGDMLTPEAKAAKAKLGGYKDAIKGSSANLKSSQELIDSLMLELQDEQAKPFQNPDKIAKIKAQLSEIQASSVQGKSPTAEMGVSQAPNMNMDARMSNANAMRSALNGKTPAEIAADPLLSKYQEALQMPGNNPTQEELYNAYAAPRQGGLKRIVPATMSRDEYMQQGSTNSKIEQLKAQLAAEEAKPIPYPGKAEAIKAEIAAEQEKVAKEKTSISDNSRLLSEQELLSKQLIPQANVLQALAGVNPEKAAGEYLDLVQKQQTSGLAGLKYQDEMAGRDAFRSAANGAGEFREIYEGGATQAKLDNADATARINNALAQNLKPSPEDIKLKLDSDKALTKFKSKLISNYPTLTQEVESVWATKPINNKEYNDAFINANTEEIVNGKDGLKDIANKATDLSAKIAAATSLSGATKDIADYTKLEKEYNTKLAQLDGNAKSQLVDKFKFKPSADVTNSIQDEEIKREANEAARSMANTTLAMKQQELARDNIAKEATIKSNLNAQASVLNTISNIYSNLFSTDEKTRRIAAFRLSKIYERKNISDEAFQEADIGRLSGSSKIAQAVDDWTKGILGLTNMADDETIERVKKDARDSYEAIQKTLNANVKNSGFAYDIPIRRLQVDKNDIPRELPYEAPKKTDMKLNPAKGEGPFEKKSSKEPKAAGTKINEKKDGYTWSGKRWLPPAGGKQ